MPLFESRTPYFEVSCAIATCVRLPGQSVGLVEDVAVDVGTDWMRDADMDSPIFMKTRVDIPINTSPPTTKTQSGERSINAKR